MKPVALTILAESPLLWGSNTDPWPEIVPQDYNDVVSALGGFWSATFSIMANDLVMEKWLHQGLMRNVQVYDYAQDQVWEGFVNRVSVEVGGVSLESGPFTNVANDVRVVYSTIFVDPSTNDQVLGTRITTSAAINDQSQDKWGVMSRVLSIAGAQEDAAEQIRDSFIAAHAWPGIAVPKRVSGRGTTRGLVRIECLGYWHLFNYPYYSTTTGTQTYTDKILDIIAYNPNTWIGFNTYAVETNTLTVPAYEQDDKISGSLLKDIACRGGSANERWTMGVYKNRKVVYAQAPTDVDYLFRVGDVKMRVLSAIGEAELRPSSMMPGRWVMFPDILAGYTPDPDPYRSMASMFIEERRYGGTPDSLQLDGTDTDTLKQLLAQLGLAGIAQ